MFAFRDAFQTRPNGLVAMLDCFSRARNDGVRVDFPIT